MFHTHSQSLRTAVRAWIEKVSRVSYCYSCCLNHVTYVSTLYNDGPLEQDQNARPTCDRQRRFIKVPSHQHTLSLAGSLIMRNAHAHACHCVHCVLCVQATIRVKKMRRSLCSKLKCPYEFNKQTSGLPRVSSRVPACKQHPNFLTDFS
jgi:hypothetical protein